jgi:hypothetical protein
MAEKTLQTRIQLKYDTWANWDTEAGKAVVLKKGEIAFVEVPSATGDITQAPALLAKVGDGVKTFSALPWLKATAADVFPWAKAETKPTYEASEISGLDAFIKGLADKDTDTQYQLVEVKTNNVVTGYKLQSKSKGGTFADISGSPVIDVMTEAEVNALIDTKLNGKNFGDIITHNASEFAATSHTHKMADVSGLQTYIDEKTAGLTGAMHFVGTATANPTSESGPAVTGVTNFAKGDVVVWNKQEYLCTTAGTNKTAVWQLFGDEGSYAVKGSIKNADIASDAAIDQSKISGLSTTLGNKVDKVAGKGLSATDVTKTMTDKWDAAYKHSQTAHNYAAASHTHNQADIVQATGDILILDCGSATKNI